MAELPSTLWMMIVVVLQQCVAVKDATITKAWDSATFDCRLDFDANLWMMRCESGNFGSEFLTFTFRGILDVKKAVGFKELLNTTTEVKVYSCNELFKALIRIDITFVTEHCRNVSEYAFQLTRILHESHIVKASITNISSLKLLKTVFEKASNLSEIRVYNSSLSNIDSLSFISNKSLQEMILEKNAIKTITSGFFGKYSHLKSLDLSENSLYSVKPTSFYGLEMLLTLDLSFNMIEIFDSAALSNTPLLETIFLQNNRLSAIDENTFAQNKALQIIDISNNNLKELPSKMFHHLPELTNVSCSNCNLSALDKDLFKYSAKLFRIRLDHNKIQTIPDTIFSHSKYLRVLQLGFNKIENLTSEMFRFLPYLRELNLTQNCVRYLERGTFDGAPTIGVLDLSKNKLDTLNDEHVEKFHNMEYLDLSHNQIVLVELGRISDIFVRKLFLSHNLISKLDVKWKRMIYLEEMYVEGNLLTSVDVPPCIPSIKQTITFSFKNNNISVINLNSLLTDESKVKTDRKMMMSCFFNGLAKNFVDFTHNPLHCDCFMFPFYKYIKDKFPRKYQLDSFLNAGNLTCAAPRWLQGKIIIELEEDAFTCQFNEDCPEPCICGIRGNDNSTFVNCSGKDLQTLHKSLPKQTTVLYFNKNRIASVELLNQMHLSGLTEIHLDENLLSSLTGWKFPPSLQYLSLRGNKLKTLPTSLMHFVRNQTDFKLFLGNNDRNCSCEREDLKNFLIESKMFIGDMDDILCQVTSNGSASYLPLELVPDSELCKPKELDYSQKTMIISLCSAFVFLITVLIFYYKQRQLILSFLYIHFDILFRLFFSEEEADSDKTFDAFIAYSSSDREIVMELLRELENHPPHFQLCIHERNWLPGRFICDNILSSVQNSKRTIVVLSNAFISSPWFNLELRAAVSKLSKDKVCRIIVILTDKTVLLSDVDPELRHVISKRTYLVWKERWFWEKLRYAMPRKKPLPADDHTLLRSLEKRDSELSLIVEAV